MHSNIKLRYKCDYALGTFSRVGLYIKLSYFVEFVKVMRFVLKQCQLKDKILFLPKSCLPFDRHTLNTFTFCDACPQSGSRTIQDCMNFYKHDFKRIFALFIWQKHPQLNFTFFSAEHKCEAFEPFRCPSDGRCISIQYLCDGAPDCSDGYDEDARLCTAGTILVIMRCQNLFFIHNFAGMLNWKICNVSNERYTYTAQSAS